LSTVTLSVESANRLLALADFALTVANSSGNNAVKAQAIEAMAELLAKGRESAQPKTDDTE
jgi:hypothetical protein